MTRYGEQEGANKEYNPNKRGRNSHHPLMAFVNDVRMVANIWLRGGNGSPANNFIGFLEDTLSPQLDDVIEVCDKTHQSDSWEHPRRMVMIRQKISERPDAAGKIGK
jgi:hypothetical protein